MSLWKGGILKFVFAPGVPARSWDSDYGDGYLVGRYQVSFSTTQDFLPVFYVSLSGPLAAFKFEFHLVSCPCVADGCSLSFSSFNVPETRRHLCLSFGKTWHMFCVHVQHVPVWFAAFADLHQGKPVNLVRPGAHEWDPNIDFYLSDHHLCHDCAKASVWPGQASLRWLQVWLCEAVLPHTYPTIIAWVARWWFFDFALVADCIWELCPLHPFLARSWYSIIFPSDPWWMVFFCSLLGLESKLHSFLNLFDDHCYRHVLDNWVSLNGSRLPRQTQG